MRTFVVILVLATGAWYVQFARAQDTDDPHGHASREDVLAEVAKGVTFVPVEAPGRASWENVAERRDGRYTAFTVSGETERIFVKDGKDGRVSELAGIPLEYRPFSDLVWKGDRLVFDRWSQPHYGVHYEFDVVRKQLVVAYGFPDS
jgi:hypothetical protein